MFLPRKEWVVGTALLFSMATPLWASAKKEAPATASEQAGLVIRADKGVDVIHPNVYGQFAEHLGNCIYGGIWVGKESSIPNTDGYRNDVMGALKALKIPNLRWPGGCFADEYHWMDGIGPKENRPKMINTNWGGVVEDNSFGTHEFLNFCELIGTQAYISANVGSGTVEELAKWVEYVNAEGETPMSRLRIQNGREKPWNVTLWGIGNESWGCGGNMRPEYYADLFRRYGTYARNYGANRLFKIACGASDYDFNWTDVMMQNAGSQMNGLSLHYYTVKGWSGSKGSATKFDLDEYYWTLGKCMEIDDVIKRHIEIMDKYDPRKRVALYVDEWGTWWDVEPGTNPGFLYQQNTLRDAFVAALTLNIFHQHADRIRGANIAQVVNVLQSMILTKEEKMVLTPTYHVFEMYNVHQGATNLPIEVQTITRSAGRYNIPTVSASASKDKAGKIHVSLANIDHEKGVEVSALIEGTNATKVSGRILTAPSVDTFNTFDAPNAVAPKSFTDATLKDGKLTVKMPARSILVMELQ